MIWFISSARTSEILPSQALLEIKRPLIRSKIKMLKVENGMIDSKKTKDTDNDSVTQSSLSNLFSAAENRLYHGMFNRMARAFIILIGRPHTGPPVPLLMPFSRL